MVVGQKAGKEKTEKREKVKRGQRGWNGAEELGWEAS